MKPKFPSSVAWPVAKVLVNRLSPVVHEIQIAGSLRRERPEVGDIEIIYIPKHGEAISPGELFADKLVNLADRAIEELMDEGFLAKRVMPHTQTTLYGPLNKCLVHVPSGIPVDLFATKATCWHNYLVCRTGPAALNQEIAARARAKGYRWNPYGSGFAPIGEGEPVRVYREQDVFDFVGLPYRDPHDREMPAKDSALSVVQHQTKPNQTNERHRADPQHRHHPALQPRRLRTRQV